MSGLREDYLIISFCGMEYRERMKWGIYLESDYVCYSADPNGN